MSVLKFKLRLVSNGLQRTLLPALTVILVVSFEFAQAGLTDWLKLGCCKRPSRASQQRIATSLRDATLGYTAYIFLKSKLDESCPAEQIDPTALGAGVILAVAKAGFDRALGWEDRAVQEKFLLEQAQLASAQGMPKWGQSPTSPLKRTT